MLEHTIIRLDGSFIMVYQRLAALYLVRAIRNRVWT